MDQPPLLVLLEAKSSGKPPVARPHRYTYWRPSYPHPPARVARAPDEQAAPSAREVLPELFPELSAGPSIGLYLDDSIYRYRCESFGRPFVRKDHEVRGLREPPSHQRGRAHDLSRIHRR